MSAWHPAPAVQAHIFQLSSPSFLAPRALEGETENAAATQQGSGKCFIVVTVLGPGQGSLLSLLNYLLQSLSNLMTDFPNLFICRHATHWLRNTEVSPIQTLRQRQCLSVQMKHSLGKTFLWAGNHTSTVTQQK